MIIENTNLGLLADELIKEINDRNNPFETYTIIVPNLLIEQWFKAYWLQKTNSVLMNVQFKRMRSYLNEIFNDTKKELFNSENLFSLILKELYQNINEYNEFSNYIIKDNSIDSNNLYDLARNLSSLFISYDNDGFTPFGEQFKLLEKIKKNYDNYIFLSDIINASNKKDAKSFVLGFRKIEKTYLDALNKINSIIYFQKTTELKNVLTVYSCASKEREIEYIHGEICKILNDNNEKVFNITVYAPNLEEYKAIIEKVFSTADNKKYPEVPYVILDSSSDDSNASLAISLLYNILSIKQFTRVDLLKLLTNSNIQKARNIDPSDINTIITSLDKMNVYRDSCKCDEWLYAIKRVLVSKLIGDNYNIENKVTIGKDSFLPYGNISLDNNIIVTLVSMIDDIIEFRNKFQNKKLFSTNDLEDLKIELNKWLLYSENEPNFYYNAALSSIDNLIKLKMDIPYEIVFVSMIEASKTISIFPSNMITGGVTFINYKENNIVSSKYMFFLGMSSNNLPRKNVNDELDLRTNKETVTSIDKDVYKLLTSNALFTYATYTNTNLQTLEDYKPSLLLNINEKSIPKLELLERRDYCDLFTKREIDKKDYAIGLIEANQNDNSNTKVYPKAEYPNTIKYTEMSKYIKENLMYKIDRLFKDNDNFSKIASKEYEPIYLNNLIESNIEKSLLLKMIENKNSEIDDLDSVIEEFKLDHSYPYIYGDENMDDLLDKTTKYYNGLGDSELREPFEIELNTIIDNKAYNWKLIINSNYMVLKEGNKITFNYAKVKLSENFNDAADLYVITLAYVAKYLTDNDNYIININHKINTRNNVPPKYSINEFVINRSKAIDILNNVYKEMFNYDDIRLRSFDLLNENSFDKFINKVVNGAWKYFDDQGLIDIRESSGYEKKDYESNNKNNSILRDEFIKFILDNVLYIVENGVENNGK